LGNEFRPKAQSRIPKEERFTPKPSRRKILFDLAEAFVNEVIRTIGKLSCSEAKALVSQVEKGVRNEEAKKKPESQPNAVSKGSIAKTLASTRKSKTATPVISLKKETIPVVEEKKASRPSSTPLKSNSRRSRTPQTSHPSLHPQKLENREKQLTFEVSSDQPSPSDCEIRNIFNNAILLTNCEGDTRFARDPLYSELTATYDNYAVVGLEKSRKNEMRLQHNVLEHRYVTRLDELQGNIALRQSNTKAELISSLPATTKLIYLQQNQTPPSIEGPTTAVVKAKRPRLP
jgi:hypothetical protein